MILLAAALLMAAPSEEEQAYQMLNRHNVAMVSTVQTEDKMTKPYSSVMGIALDEGVPFVFISDLAVHTENIKKSPHSSLMIFEPKKTNVFDSPRVTFNGKFVLVKDEKKIAKLRKLYLKKHPDAKEFIDFGDFNYYMMEIESIYFVGGFGDESYIGWLDPKDYKKAVKKLLSP